MRVVLALVVLAASFRCVYFVQLNSSPCVQQDRWEQTDMHFFDVWATQIASGDWLTNQALHPLVDWQREISKGVMESRPELKKSVEDEATATGNSDLDRVLWNRWLGGKCFHQEPLYAYLLAATYTIFGHDVRWVFAWQMLLGIGTILLIYKIGCSYFGELAGTFAALLALFYAPLMYYELILLRESLVVFIGLALVYLWTKASSRKTMLWWLGLGFLSGLAIVLKITFVLFLFAFLFALGITNRQQPKAFLRSALAILGGTAIAVSPFVVRNLAVGVAPFTMSSTGMNSVSLVFFDSADSCDENGTLMISSYAQQIMAETQGKFLPTAVMALKTHKDVWSFANLIRQKLNLALRWYEIPNNENFYYYRIHAAILGWLPITFCVAASLAFLGIPLSLQDRKKIWPLYFLLLSSLAPLLILTPISRYRLPLSAVLIFFAGLALARLVEWASQRRIIHLIPGCTTVILATLWIGRPLPAGQTEIRIADYAAPYGYYYRPQMDSAIKRDDWISVERLLQSAFVAEPDFVKKYRPPQPLGSREEADTAILFSWTHFAYATCLNHLGKKDEAALQLQRSNELRSAKQ